MIVRLAFDPLFTSERPRVEVPTLPSRERSLLVDRAHLRHGFSVRAVDVDARPHPLVWVLIDEFPEIDGAVVGAALDPLPIKTDEELWAEFERPVEPPPPPVFADRGEPFPTLS